MSEPADLSAAIEAAAAQPQAVSVDGVSSTQRPLAELIEADRYLRERAAAKRPTLGLRLRKVTFGSAE